MEEVVVGEGVGETEEYNTGSHIEVAKLPVFNGEVGRVEGFITVCRLYLRIRMGEAIVEKQI